MSKSPGPSAMTGNTANLAEVRIIAQIQKDFVEWVMVLDDENLDVVLTGKSRAHYLTKHPEMGACERLLPRVLQAPTEVYRVFTDPRQVIFVRRMLGDRYLMAGVLLDPTGQEKKHSVLTYHRLNPRTYRQQRNKGEVIWRRGGSS